MNDVSVVPTRKSPIMRLRDGLWILAWPARDWLTSDEFPGGVLQAALSLIGFLFGMVTTIILAVVVGLMYADVCSTWWLAFPGFTATLYFIMYVLYETSMEEGDRANWPTIVTIPPAKQSLLARAIIAPCTLILWAPIYWSDTDEELCETYRDRRENFIDGAKPLVALSAITALALTYYGFWGQAWFVPVGFFGVYILEGLVLLFLESRDGTS